MSNVSAKHISDEWIQEYLDGELDGARFDALHAHLERCPGCQQRLETWRSLFIEIEGAAELDPSLDMTPAVLSRLDIPDRLHRWNPGLLIGQAILAIAFLVYGWMQWPTLLDIDRLRAWVSVPWQTLDQMVDQLIHSVMGTLQQLTTWTPSSGDLIANIPQISAERSLLIYLGPFLIILWLAINRSLLKVNGQSRDIQSGG